MKRNRISRKPIVASLIVAGLVFCMPGVAAKAAPSSASVTQKNIQEFKYDMKTKLAEVDAKLEGLQNKISKEANENRKEVNIALQKRVNELKEMRVDIANKMDSLQESSSDHYAELKSSIETAYSNLKSELDKTFH